MNREICLVNVLNVTEECNRGDIWKPWDSTWACTVVVVTPEADHRKNTHVLEVWKTPEMSLKTHFILQNDERIAAEFLNRLRGVQFTDFSQSWPETPGLGSLRGGGVAGKFPKDHVSTKPPPVFSPSQCSIPPSEVQNQKPQIRQKFPRKDPKGNSRRRLLLHTKELIHHILQSTPIPQLPAIVQPPLISRSRVPGNEPAPKRKKHKYLCPQHPTILVLGARRPGPATSPAPTGLEFQIQLAPHRP